MILLPGKDGRAWRKGRNRDLALSAALVVITCEQTRGRPRMRAAFTGQPGQGKNKEGVMRVVWG